MAFNRVPQMVVTLGQQYNVGKRPIVILYTYINRHAGTPSKTEATDTMNLDTTNFRYIGIGWVSTLLYYHIISRQTS